MKMSREKKMNKFNEEFYIPVTVHRNRFIFK